MTTVYKQSRVFTVSKEAIIQRMFWWNPPDSEVYQGKHIDLSKVQVMWEGDNYEYTDITADCVFDPEDGFYINPGIAEGSTFDIVATYLRQGRSSHIAQTVTVKSFDPRRFIADDELFHPTYFSFPFRIYKDVENFVFRDPNIGGKPYLGFKLESYTSPVYGVYLYPGFVSGTAAAHISLCSKEPFSFYEQEWYPNQSSHNTREDAYLHPSNSPYTASQKTTKKGRTVYRQTGWKTFSGYASLSWITGSMSLNRLSVPASDRSNYPQSDVFADVAAIAVYGDEYE